MAKESLKKAGLSDGESSVYLALLKLGITTTGKIIKETQLQSSSIYHILDSLLQKGIASYEIKNKRKLFFAASPDRLLGILEDKKNKIEDVKNEIQKLMPELNALMAFNKTPEQEILIFTGWKGVLSAFLEAYKQIKPGTTAYAYTLTKEHGSADLKQYRWLINKVRETREIINKKNKKKSIMKIIAEKGSQIGIDQSKTPYTYVKFIDRHLTSPAVVNIYGDVTLIALWTKTPIGFYIISKEVADSFRNNFNLMWEMPK